MSKVKIFNWFITRNTAISSNNFATDSITRIGVWPATWVITKDVTEDATEATIEFAINIELENV